MEGKTFTFVDVGGQRNERKKWIHSFANITSILFIASLSEYDQTLFEDEKTNRMQESLDVFAGIINSNFFSSTPIILFLNKRDILSLKVSQGTLPSVIFPEYSGGNDHSKAASFIEQKYLEQIKQNPGSKPRRIFTHFVTSIDTENLSRVWNDCRKIIVGNALQSMGFEF
jgi:hypothetical protein